jgi:hypothetical protein
MQAASRLAASHAALKLDLNGNPAVVPLPHHVRRLVAHWRRQSSIRSCKGFPYKDVGLTVTIEGGRHD